MKCQDFRELIDSYLCDELLTETNHEVLRHLEKCANCRSVIEERRIFRARLRSAVQNFEEHKICEKFNVNLQVSLRQSILPRTQVKKSFFTINYSWAAMAASFLIIAVLGIWFFQNRNVNIPPDIANIERNYQLASLQKVALGDHKNCAINHSLEEKPVKIDLSSPQYANLREGILLPLKKEFNGCNLVASHICKYGGQTFTHLVFNYDGKTMSILMLDLNENKTPENKYIDKLSDEGYQIAHFDVEKKAVFVISDLPEQKNTAAAEVLETPLRQQLSNNQQASLVSFADYRH